MREDDRACSLILLGIALAACFGSFQYEVGTFNNPGPGLFPLVLGVVLGVLSLIILAGGIVAKRAAVQGGRGGGRALHTQQRSLLCGPGPYRFWVFAGAAGLHRHHLRGFRGLAALRDQPEVAYGHYRGVGAGSGRIRGVRRAPGRPSCRAGFWESEAKGRAFSGNTQLSFIRLSGSPGRA